MKIRYLVSTAGLALGLGFSIAAQAQSAQNSADSDDATVGEIIVTANKREQSINKVGLAITAVTGETLAQQRVVSLSDLANTVPGLSYAPSATQTPVYTLRGVGLFPVSTFVPDLRL